MNNDKIEDISIIVGFKEDKKAYKKFFLESIPPVIPNIGDYLTAKVYYFEADAEYKPHQIHTTLDAVRITGRHIAQSYDGKWYIQYNAYY